MTRGWGEGETRGREMGRRANGGHGAQTGDAETGDAEILSPFLPIPASPLLRFPASPRRNGRSYLTDRLATRDVDRDGVVMHGHVLA